MKAKLLSLAGSGLGPQGKGMAYLSVGKAYHGLHHGYTLSVLQRIEGTVVLQRRKVENTGTPLSSELTHPAMTFLLDFIV